MKPKIAKIDKKLKPQNVKKLKQTETKNYQNCNKLKPQNIEKLKQNVTTKL